jgi:hypothetical protein
LDRPSDRIESFDIQDRVPRLWRLRRAGAARDRRPAADADAAAAERDATRALQVILADDSCDRDHVALACLDLVEDLLLARQPEATADFDLDAGALSFGALGDDEGAALRAAGDRDTDRVLGNGTLLLSGERDADSEEENRNSAFHSHSLNLCPS